MKKFLYRFLLFLIPFYIIGFTIILCGVAGYKTGELCEFDDLIGKQRANHSVLIGMGYNEQTPYYKLKNANYYQADVIALGTSRVMQFKFDYFSEGFYNCGGAVSQNYDEYLNFLKNLNYQPKLIILGLDEWIFNDAWNQYCAEYSEFQAITLNDRNKWSIIWEMIKDLISNKWNFSQIDNYSENYGFNGRIKENGFCWDGSYYYGATYRNPELQKDYMFADTFDRINFGRYRFEWGGHADNQRAFEQLENFLAYCKNNDIIVIGFTPPYAPSVYDKMMQSGNYGYLAEITPMCEMIFKSFDYEYYDYMDSTLLGLDDTYFVDGFHGNDVVYANIIDDILKQGSYLGSYINKEKLYLWKTR